MKGLLNILIGHYKMKETMQTAKKILAEATLGIKLPRATKRAIIALDEVKISRCIILG